MPQHPEDGGIRQFILRQVLHNVRCGACGARYGGGDVTIVENHDGVWMLSAVCPDCDSQAMVMVVVHERSSGRMALPSLSREDVLNFHAAIAGFGGDLRELVGPVTPAGGLS